MNGSRYHDLPEVGGVGKDFLIASHPCIKADFTKSTTFFSYGFSIENSAVLQEDNCWFFLCIFHWIITMILCCKYTSFF